MAWSGKVLGGLVGGMVGGPLGVGVGAALGHYLGDQDSRALKILRLEWADHGFGPSGPGLRVTPVWRARGHAGRDCRVRLVAGEHRDEATVVPDEEDETCALPEFCVPYAGFDGILDVTLDSSRSAPHAVRLEVPLPSPVRRLGLSGPARLVMALVGCARAGGRELGRDDVRFIRETFTASMPLDDDGRTWLREWLRALRAAEPVRLDSSRVARRLERHFTGEDSLRLDDVLLWGMRGVREAWPGAAQEAWIAAFADALGVDAARLGALWAELDDPESPEAADARAVLGVAADATEEAIKAAWRRLAHAHHPDHARGAAGIAEANRRMAAINAAWRVLRGG